jgi:hypothetical protein
MGEPANQEKRMHLSSNRKLQSLLCLVAIAGAIGSVSALSSRAAAQEDDRYNPPGPLGEWAELPPPVPNQRSGVRAGSATCSLDLGVGQLLDVTIDAHIHEPFDPRHPGDAYVELRDPRQRLFQPQLRQRSPEVQAELVCATSAESGDAEQFTSDFLPFANNAPSAVFPCPDTKPYLIQAACRTRTLRATPVDPGTTERGATDGSATDVSVTDVSVTDTERVDGSTEADVAEGEAADREVADDLESAELSLAEAPTYALADSSGTVIADVTANGTGCPAGTWSAKLSEDKSAFTIAFEEYVAQVKPGEALDVADCLISVTPRVVGGEVYVLDSLLWDGHVELTNGVNATSSVGHYLQGAPGAAEPTVDHVYDGPTELSLSSVTPLDPGACAAERTVNIRTRVRVRNNAEASGTGSIRFDGTQGTTQLKVRKVPSDC